MPPVQKSKALLCLIICEASKSGSIKRKYLSRQTRFVYDNGQVTLKEEEPDMLVLTRKPGQRVYIGDEVKITLMEIRGNQVRIGIDAPSSVRIYREEIYLQIEEENKSAAVFTPAAQDDLSGVIDAWKKKDA